MKPTDTCSFPPNDKTSETFSSRIIELAQTINQKKALFFLYGFLDGLDIAIKALLMFTPLLTSIALNIWVLTPIGFYLALLFTSAYALLAAFGNVFHQSENKTEKQIAEFWQSLRDPSKACRSACMSIIYMLSLIKAFTAKNVTALFTPIAIPVVMVTMLNRIWRRTVGNQHKAIQKNNQNLLKTLQKKWTDLNKGLLSEKDYLNFVTDAKSNLLKSESDKILAACFLSGFIEACTNGPYIFMGLFVIASFSSTGLLFAASISIAFVLFGTLTKWHEEHDSQIKLRLSEQTFLLTCAIHAVELSLLKRHQASDEILKDQLTKHTLTQYEALKNIQNKCDALCKTSFNESIVVGLRYGVGIHQVLMVGFVITELLKTLIFGTLLSEFFILTMMMASLITTIALTFHTVYDTMHASDVQHKEMTQKKAVLEAHVSLHINPRYQFIGQTASQPLSLERIQNTPLARHSLIPNCEKTRSSLAGGRKPTSLLEFFLIMNGEPAKKGFQDNYLRTLLVFLIACYTLLWVKDADNKQQQTPSGTRFKSASPELNETTPKP